MTYDRNPANRPSRLTHADMQRQQKAIAAHDARIAKRKRNETIAAIAYNLAVVAVLIVLFYSATNN